MKISGGEIIATSQVMYSLFSLGDINMTSGHKTQTACIVLAVAWPQAFFPTYSM